MFLNRQNIITKLSSKSKIKHPAFHEYGYSQVIQNQKKILRKSKSHGDVLIAKNKKLNNFFPFQEYKNNNQSSVIKRTVSKEDHLKLTLSCQKSGKTIHQTNQKQHIQTFRTSYFGSGPQLSLQSDKNNFKQFKQRFKKTSSMKNLIQQKFPSQYQQSKRKKQQIHQDINKKNEETTYNSQNNYDSSKYNWRLSRSKEKSIEKRGSFQSNYKLNPGIQKNQINKNKLHIESKNEKKNNVEEGMKFTFGSNVYQNNRFK